MKPQIKRGPKSRMKLRMTEPATPYFNRRSSCNEGFPGRKTDSFKTDRKNRSRMRLQ